MPNNKVSEIEKILKDHYWDSLEKDRGIIEKHCDGIAQAILSWHSAELCRELENIMQEYWADPEGAYTTIIKAKIDKIKGEL